MKRNSLFLACSIVVLSLSFTSCKDKSWESYPDDIIGTWISVEVDGKEPLTNDVFINEFTSAGKEIYAAQQPMTNGTEWIVNSPVNYSLDEDVLTESGTDRDGKKYSYKSKIKIENDYLYFEVLEYIYDGVNMSDNSTFTMKRVSANSSIIGIWKGKEVTNPTTSLHDSYWEYLPDGSYNYYYYDEDSESYLLKDDNNGKYFVYGNLLASNFSNNILTGGSGRESENWFFSISGNTMTWTAKRENNSTPSFVMQKVNAVE